MVDVFTLPPLPDTPAPPVTTIGAKLHNLWMHLSHPADYMRIRWAQIWFQSILLVSRELTQPPVFNRPAATEDEADRDISIIKYFAACLSSHEDAARIEGQPINSLSHETGFNSLDKFVDNIYHMLIALALLRTKQRFERSSQVVTRQAEEFNSIQVTITSRPYYHFLAAYLVAGVRGLLLIPSDLRKFPISHSLQLITLVSKANQLQPKDIKESVWKRTNAYIVQLIQDCFFSPQFLPGTRVSRVDIAKCLVLDFSDHWLEKNPPTDSPLFSLPRKANVTISSIQDLS